jgi:CheY-like chemotaxis protein
MNINPLNNHRLLVIDDNAAIHEDFRKILLTEAHLPNDLAEDEAALFGQTTVKFQPPIFEIDSAYQGQEGLELVEKSLWEERPYALAFIDVRMPPGWDGVETTSRIWERYPDLQVVICTAYSDYSWEDMLRKLGFSDRLLILKKPFDNIEVLQSAIAMTEKWRLFSRSSFVWMISKRWLRSALLRCKPPISRLISPLADPLARASPNSLLVVFVLGLCRPQVRHDSVEVRVEAHRRRAKKLEHLASRVDRERRDKESEDENDFFGMIAGVFRRACKSVKGEKRRRGSDPAMTSRTRTTTIYWAGVGGLPLVGVWRRSLDSGLSFTHKSTAIRQSL